MKATPTSDKPPEPGAATAGETTRRDTIHAAAIIEFSQRGFAATSMANIAHAAGVSRPALYQYFRDKTDIFASAFISLLEAAADRSLRALDAEGSAAMQLDGFLQRFDGDLWEQTSASPHSDEILSIKTAGVAEAATDVIAARRDGLSTYLTNITRHMGIGAQDANRADWIEMLELSPKGFKFDRPSVASYRRRLTTLARSVAADIERA